MTLRFRLMLLVGAVVAASLAAVFFGSSRVVRVEIQKLEDNGKTLDASPLSARQTIRERLAAHHAAHGWTNIEAELRRLHRERAPGRPLLLVSGRSRLIAASSLPPGGVRLSPRGSDGLVVEYSAQAAPVRVMVFPDPGDTEQSFPATLYAVPEWRRQPVVLSRTINQRLLLMVIGIAALALPATALIARTAVRPIEQLQAAVQRVAGGALGAQVQVTSQDEVGSLASTFNAMSAQLARDETMRRNMVNDVAHELRTPLTRLLCTVESVQDGLRPADAAVLTALHDDLGVLQRLVEDLETLALAESGKLPLHPEPLDVGAHINRWVQAQPDADRARIDLAVSQPLCVRVDRVRFQQIVANLVRNALLHGGATSRVRVAIEGTPEAVRVVVSDNGAGIDAAHLPYVFDRFYRADSARGRSTGGSGLGLAIVKQLVELQGGRIAVDSTPDQGTTFAVSFPASSDATIR